MPKEIPRLIKVLRLEEYSRARMGKAVRDLTCSQFTVDDDCHSRF